VNEHFWFKDIQTAFAAQPKSCAERASGRSVDCILIHGELAALPGSPYQSTRYQQLMEHSKSQLLCNNAK
jgi:hypothetical protein